MRAHGPILLEYPPHRWVRQDRGALRLSPLSEVLNGVLMMGDAKLGVYGYREKGDVARGLSLERFAVHGYGCIESRGGGVFLSTPSNCAGRPRQGGGTQLRHTADLWCYFSIRASFSRGSSGSRSGTFVVTRYPAAL